METDIKNNAKKILAPLALGFCNRLVRKLLLSISSFFAKLYVINKAVLTESLNFNILKKKMQIKFIVVNSAEA